MRASAREHWTQAADLAWVFAEQLEGGVEWLHKHRWNVLKLLLSIPPSMTESRAHSSMKLWAGKAEEIDTMLDDHAILQDMPLQDFMEGVPGPSRNGAARQSYPVRSCAQTATSAASPA